MHSPRTRTRQTAARRAANRKPRAASSRGKAILLRTDRDDHTPFAWLAAVRAALTLSRR